MVYKTYDKKNIHSIQIEVVKVETQPIFASLYKYYQKESFGYLEVRNIGKEKIQGVAVETHLKKYMDYPSESTLKHELKPGEISKIPLYVTLNNEILKIAEDTSLNIQMKVKYREGSQMREVRKTHAVQVYNKNALTWNNVSKLGSFITFRDPAVTVFARSVNRLIRENPVKHSLHPKIHQAITLFHALQEYGISYAVDPTTPFRDVSRSSDEIDYIQYPREVLRFKSGDCDDLTALFSALFENLGVETALVNAPGHIFLLFNTGLPASKRLEISENPELTAVFRNTVWIPLEITLIGDNFFNAWQRGGKLYHRLQENNQVQVVAMENAWKKFPPVNLPHNMWEPSMPRYNLFSSDIARDTQSIMNLEMALQLTKWKKERDKNPSDPKIYNKIGIIYARFQVFDKAIKFFKMSLKMDPAYFSPHNNLANIHLIRQDYQKALKYYLKAKELNPGHPYIRLNLSLIYQKLREKSKMESELKVVYELSPDLHREYARILRDSGLKFGDEDNLMQYYLLWTGNQKAKQINEKKSIFKN
jgi:hypothetical protein